VAETDPLESDMLAGAAAALRKRADRQAKIAASWTTIGDRGAVIKRGEAAIAERMSTVLAQLADEFEQERPRDLWRSAEVSASR
jgi:hypothetical protein